MVLIRPVSVHAKLEMCSGDPRGWYERLGFERTGAMNRAGTTEEMVRGSGSRDGGGEA
jgi:hypothetical protein